MTHQHPELWAVAARSELGFTRDIHYPDLAINLEAQRGESPVSYFVEIELNAKQGTDYGKILRTYKAELDSGWLYEKVLYFTNSEEVRNAISKADKKAKTGLVNKQLFFAPLVGRDGKPLALGRRVGDAR